MGEHWSRLYADGLFEHRNAFESMEKTPAKKEEATIKPRRIRNPELRRAAILEAAFAAFSERGYSGATLREIAARAGVSHGLLKQHFGSKEQLFLAAIPGTRDWKDVVFGEGEGSAAERIVAAFTKREEAGTGLDVLVTLIRAAAEDVQGADTLFEAVRDATIELYSPLLTGEDSRTRIEFLMAFLIGVTFSRHMVAGGLLATMDHQSFSRLLASMLDQILWADGSTPPGR
ncbi:TetR/AcrR family transcriptional regulator [Sphingobium yanoikuyae]|uniref:TetR family transcriptional regulator n=2 Tax=Sphingobium yanoikuyae TaxID=13690 RepID=A0A9X7YB15_SPHYA|nr:TetR/AcrR family transcriptional regulator [Sphingobium yanoikuyae]QNG43962.1 TetR family transcriptional regulator [Sphingobium yanoikuyae]